MEQLPQVIIALVMTLVMVLAATGSSGSSEADSPIIITQPSPNEVDDNPPPALTSALIVRLNDGNVQVNLLSVGTSLTTMRAMVDLPEDHRRVAVEDGTTHDEYVFGDARYFVADGELKEIRIKRTPEGIQPGMSLKRAQETYGRPLHAFINNSTNRNYVVFPDSRDNNTVWIMGMDTATRTITSVSHALGYDRYARAAATSGLKIDDSGLLSGGSSSGLFGSS